MSCIVRSTNAWKRIRSSSFEAWLRSNPKHLRGRFASGSGETVGFGELSVHDLRMKMEEDPNLVIVDVREPSEYVEGHVPGAVNVPLSTLSDAAKQGRFDGYEDRTVHIICQLGGRSKKACLALSEQYQTLDLINVMGGTAEWIQSGYDVQK